MIYRDDRDRTWKRGGTLPEGSGEVQAAEPMDLVLFSNPADVKRVGMTVRASR